VTDPKIIDVLISKERMEYQEIMNCWKMNDQLLGLFAQPDGGKPAEGTFLQKFYQGEYRLVSLSLG
jgi:NADH dehydrogenase (ubiquinone) 1 alpha subcomplex subunit 6